MLGNSEDICVRDETNLNESLRCKLRENRSKPRTLGRDTIVVTENANKNLVSNAEVYLGIVPTVDRAPATNNFPGNNNYGHALNFLHLRANGGTKTNKLFPSR